MGWILFISVLIGLSVSLTSAAAAQLFGVGEEYKYKYEALVIAGSQEPAPFASAYKIQGNLNVAAISATTLSISMDDLAIGLYNGPWSYFPIPDFKFLSPPELAPLGESFQIVLQDGKFKTLILNDGEPEWASNLKRGFATYLQMDLKSVTSFDKVQILNLSEMTTMGECPTKYEVIPGSTTLNKLTRVSKFRNHVDCPDMPKRARLPLDTFYSCTDGQTQDIANSTSYSTYEMELTNGQPLLKSFNVYSSLLLWPFTTQSAFRYSWLNMTLTLLSHSKFGDKTFPPPENAENHEDLSFVFEQPDPTDTEDENLELSNLKSETIFFHHISVDPDSEFHDKTLKLFQEKISELAETLLNTKERIINHQYYQGKAQLAFLTLAASLDYDHLTQAYTKYSTAAGSSQLNLTEFQIFLDGLILAGTTPASLVIRDILLASEDIAVHARIAPLFPYYIRNPMEALAKEMDPIFDMVSKPSVSSTIRRMLEFSMASLIGRCCKKTLCVTSGLLTKYITYFENKLKTAENFQDRTSAVLALGNLGQGDALNKVLEIATGTLNYGQNVRVQAIWAVKSLAFQDPPKVFDALLPVFFNRSESCEVRTTVFTFLMSVNPQKRVLHEIAYFMWTETCPQTLNVVRSFLTNAIKSQSPCNKIGHYARTILQYLPPYTIDPIRTTTYGIDYYDKDFGFGHQIQSTVQKSGYSALPVSVYVGLNNYVGGYGSSYVGLFIRMEGLDKEIATRLSEIGSVNIEEVQKILSKIGVVQRPSVPLRLEFTLFFHGHAVSHYSADEKSIANIPIFLKKLGELSERNIFNWERTMTLGGIFYQQPLEIGVPLSVFAGVTATGSLSSNFTKSSEGSSLTQDFATRLQFHLMGYFQIANHAPAVGTLHAITAYRTFRVNVPRHIAFGIDSKELGKIKITSEIPTSKNPFFIMAHATAETSLAYDSTSRVKDDIALNILKQSCAACHATYVVSKGDAFRKSRLIPGLAPAMPGVRFEAKYFDCERDHSRAASVKKLGEFLNDQNQNTGFYDFPLSKLILSMQHARHYAFFAPYPETCGISLFISQDEDGPTKLSAVESKLTLNFSSAPVFSPNKDLTFAMNSKLKLIYTGTQPPASSINGFNLDMSLIGKNDDITGAKFRAELLDSASAVKKILCVDATLKKERLPKDLLSYTGENEPVLEQRIWFSSGKTAGPGALGSCPTDQAEITIVGEAHRSVEQIEEANAAATPPYAQCKAQQASKNYPGSFIPPTADCFMAAIQQTYLRSANSTISYKISEEVRNRWKRPIIFLSSFLQAYAVDNPDDHSHAETSGSISSKNKNVYEGEIEFDVNFQKDSSTASTMDIHYRSLSGGDENEEHFHDIDLSILPKELIGGPVPARFSQLFLLAYKLGAIGSCSVYPSIVQTFDGFTYPAELPDCQTVISADCGARPKYAVLAKRLSPEKLVVTIQLGDNEIKLDGSNNVVVNGAKMTLPDKQTTAGKQRSGTLPMFSFLKNGNEITVTSVMLGVGVRYTGAFVTVSLSARYRGVHCGLCGHWDSTFYNDLIGPDPTCPAGLLSPPNLVKTYTIREGSCSALSANRCPN